MQEGATKYNVVYVKILHHPQRSSVVTKAYKCLNITFQTCSMRNITPIATVELFGVQSNQSNFNVQFIGLQLKCITSLWCNAGAGGRRCTDGSCARLSNCEVLTRAPSQFSYTSADPHIFYHNSNG